MEARRSNPRLWDTDWLVLRALSGVLTKQLGAHLTPGSLLVDLGCGDMPYKDRVEALGVTYASADIDSGGDLVIAADGKVELPTGSVDAVLSVQVLEHVGDLDAYCSEIRRLLGPTGTLFLSTHGTWLYHPHPTDYWRWTRSGLERTLKSQGFTVHETTGLVGPLATTTLIRLTGLAWALRRIPMIGSPLARLVAIIMNLRAWLEDSVTPEEHRRDNACVYWIRASKVQP